MMIALIISILLSISAINATINCNFSSPTNSETFNIGESINISLSVEGTGSSTYTFAGSLLQPPNTVGPQNLGSIYFAGSNTYSVLGQITVPNTFSSGEATVSVEGVNSGENFTCTVPINIAPTTSPACTFTLPSLTTAYTVGALLPISLSVTNASSALYTFTGELSQLLNLYGPVYLTQSTSGTGPTYDYTVTGNISIPTYYTSGIAFLTVTGADNAVIPGENITCQTAFAVNAVTPTPAPTPVTPCYPYYPCYSSFRIPFETKRPDCRIPKCPRRCRVYGAEVDEVNQLIIALDDLTFFQQEQQQQQLDLQQQQLDLEQQQLHQDIQIIEAF